MLTCCNTMENLLKTLLLKINGVKLSFCIQSNFAYSVYIY